MQGLTRALDRVNQQSGEDCRNRKELEGEIGDHAEVTTAATKSPEQFGILGFTGLNNRPVRGDDLGGDHVVAGKSVRAHQPTQTTAEGETANSGRGDCAAGSSKTMSGGRGIEITPVCAALGAGRAGNGIDHNISHASEIDHERAIRDGETCGVMSSAADRDTETGGRCVLDRGDNIGGVEAVRNEGGTLIDHAVPDRSRLVVTRIAVGHDLTAKCLDRCDHRSVPPG